MRQIIMAIAATGATLNFCNPASAQTARSRYQGRVSVNQILRNNPAVSPYINLLTNQASLGGASRPTYQTLVRPQIEARMEAQRQRRQVSQLQNQVSSIRRNMQQTPVFGQTGHPTRFMTYLHYYPQLGQ